MKSQSIADLIFFKRIAFVVLAIMITLILFIFSALFEVNRSEHQAKSVSGLIVSVIKKLSDQGELLYAQREIESIKNSMHFVGDIDINLEVVSTRNILARIESKSMSYFDVHRIEIFEAIPFGKIELNVRVDIFDRILNSFYLSLALSIFFISAFVLTYFLIDRREKRFFVSLNEVLNWINNLKLQEGMTPLYELDKIEKSIPNNLLSTAYLSIVNLVNENVRLQLDRNFANLAQQVAHDVRSPLSVFNMLIPLLKNEKNTETIELLIQASNRINNIASDLLNKSNSIDSNKGFLSSCEIGRVVKEVIVEKRVTEKQRKIVFNNQMNSGSKKYQCLSESELARILSNLVNNSIEATSVSKGLIKIDLIEEVDYIVISITDNGRGIPTELLDQIGKKGFSHGKERDTNAGFGLGVYHAKSTIHATGGTFSIESSIGKGTKIKICLRSANQS